MALTWREVSAPDLSTSLRGYEMFGRGIENALGGLRNTLNDIDQQKTQEASQALMLQALQAQDPNAVRAIVAGANPARVNSAAIAMLSQRPGQILQEQNQELALKGARRTDAQTEAFDALASDQARAEEARAQGRPDTALEASIMGRLSSIGGRNAMAVTDSLRAADIWGIDRTGKLQDQSIQRDQNTRAWNDDKRAQGRFAMDQTKFSWEKDDRDVEQAANILAPEIFDRGLDPEGIRGLIMQQNPRVRGALLRQASQFGYGNVFQPGDVGLSSASSTGESGIPGMVASESGGNWGALNSEGYGGRLQFGTARLADAAKAGLVPKGTTGADFSRMPPSQQKIVEDWHWRDIDNQTKDLSQYHGKTVAGVPINRNSIRAMAQLGGVTGAKKFIQTGGKYNPADSNGTRLSDYGARFAGAGSADFDRVNPLTTVATSVGTKIRNAQDQNDPVFQIYNSGLDKAGVSTEEVATRLAGGTLKGIPAAYMRDRIQEIISQSGGRLNPTQAGDLLAKNIKTNDSWYNRLTGRGSFWGDTFGGETNLAGGRRLNKEALDADIQKVLTGNPTDRTQTIAVREALTAQLGAAQQRADAANAALARVQAQAGAGRNVDPSVLHRYQVNAATANAAALAIQRRLTNADSQPERSTQQQLPASTANPRNRFTGAPVRQGSLLSQIYNDWFGS